MTTGRINEVVYFICFLSSCSFLFFFSFSFFSVLSFLILFLFYTIFFREKFRCFCGMFRVSSHFFLCFPFFFL